MAAVQHWVRLLGNDAVPGKAKVGHDPQHNQQSQLTKGPCSGSRT